MTTTDSDERKLVLEMLSEGKISVDEAQKLLDKLKEVEGRRQVNGEASGAGSASKPKPKHLRVVIGGGEDVDLRIPIGLVRAGLALDSFLPRWARSKFIVGSSLSEVTVLDNDYIRENLDTLDMSFDSEDGEESVHIFTE